MAAVPLPSINFSEKLSPISFCFNAVNTPVITFFGGLKLKLKPLETKRWRNNFVCRAASSVAIRDLDADDIRHPLDKQVIQCLFDYFSVFCFRSTIYYNFSDFFWVFYFRIR